MRAGSRATTAAGFTLLEALVAIAILSICILSLVGLRTDAVVTATKTRNLRLAKELAEKKLAEVESGALEMLESGVEHSFEKYPKFSWTVLIGDESADQDELEQTSNQDLQKGTDKASWLQQRQEDQRRKREERLALGGGSTNTNDPQAAREDPLKKIQQQETVPTEDDLETVVVVVKYPNVAAGLGSEIARFTLKTKVSTLALSGLTTKQADEKAAAAGEAAKTTSGKRAGNSPAGGGNPAGSTGGEGISK
jgi:prepilin-type N-terminal cleavage/methylation domain-containing protein